MGGYFSKTEDTSNEYAQSLGIPNAFELFIPERMEIYKDVKMLTGPIVVHLKVAQFEKITKLANDLLSQSFADCIHKTAEQMMRRFRPATAYISHGEINLIFGDNMPFNGNSDKMLSALSSYASSTLTKFLTSAKFDTVLQRTAYQISGLTMTGYILDTPNNCEVYNYIMLKQTQSVNYAYQTLASMNNINTHDVSINDLKIVLSGIVKKIPDNILYGTFIKFQEYPCDNENYNYADGRHNTFYIRKHLNSETFKLIGYNETFASFLTSPVLIPEYPLESLRDWSY